MHIENKLVKIVITSDHEFEEIVEESGGDSRAGGGPGAATD